MRFLGLKNLAYLRNLTKFAFSKNPALLLALFISVFSSGIELLAMSSLLPLSTLANGQVPPEQSFWAKTLSFLGYSLTVRNLIIAFSLLFTLRILTQLWGQGLSLLIGKKLHAQLSSSAFQNIVKHKSLDFVEKKSAGYFVSLAGDESFRASTLLISCSQFVSQITLCILYFVAIARASATAAYAVLIFLAVCLACLSGIFLKSFRLGSISARQSKEAGSVFIDGINGFKSIRALSAEDFVTQSYQYKIFEYVRTLFKIDFLNLFSRLAPVAVLMFFLLGYVVLSPADLGAHNLPFVLTLIVYLMRFFPTVGQTLNLALRVTSDAKSGQDVTELIRQENVQQINALAFQKRIVEIEFENVNFSYSSQTSIFNQLSLRFEAGKSYAIYGPSGSGKSTLLDLLLGFRNPSQGSISINQIDLRRLNRDDFRKQIVLVTQGTMLFNDTVKNNVCFGRESTTNEIDAACRTAELSEVIESLPLKLEELLQYQGTNLSGGQRQRLGLARGVIREASVLVLDEVTSALDNETKETVVANLLNAYRDKILIFVTHDSALAEKVDVALELERPQNEKITLVKPFSFAHAASTRALEYANDGGRDNG